MNKVTSIRDCITLLYSGDPVKRVVSYRKRIETPARNSELRPTKDILGIKLISEYQNGPLEQRKQLRVVSPHLFLCSCSLYHVCRIAPVSSVSRTREGSSS